jgi:hypothetical protein
MKPRLREISRFVPGRGWVHPTKAQPTPPAPRPLDAFDVLMAARRVACRLQGEGAHVAPDALAAITTHRHGPQGQRWAAGILATLGDATGAGALEAAIEKALTNKGQVRR